MIKATILLLLLVFITGCDDDALRGAIAAYEGYRDAREKVERAEAASYSDIFLKLRRGQHLIAQDGTYLGVLDSEFVSKSIFNDFGKYGSEFSSTSIWNDFGKYGSEFSSLSAFNDFASKPPLLVDEYGFICYVTTNTLKMPRVSPYSLIAFAESMRWK